jgi:hypothetical protein
MHRISGAQWFQEALAEQSDLRLNTLFSNCQQEQCICCKQSWKQYAAVEQKQELLWRRHGLKASMKQN